MDSIFLLCMCTEENTRKSLDNVLDIDRTMKGSYIAKAQEILMESSEAQAEFMIKMLEYMSQNMGRLK